MGGRGPRQWPDPVRRSLKRGRAGLAPGDLKTESSKRTPRETRHTFVSIASDHGTSIEDIADAAGHVNPNVTSAVYRHQISDTVTRAPAALDQALAAGGEQA